MTVAEVFLILGLLWTMLALVVLLIVAILGYRIVGRLYPAPELAHRPVPPPSAVHDLAPKKKKVPPAVSTVAYDDSEPVQGRNAFPVDEEPQTPQIADDSELALMEEREEAWRALREEGYTDEEIATMERDSAIKVFD